MVTLRLDQLPHELDGVIQRASSLNRPLAVGAMMALSETKQRFMESKGPDGVAWTPTKFRPEGVGKTLLDKGTLLGSLHSASDHNSITVGTNLQKAAILHNGGTIFPRRGKYLAIPLTVEAKRAGSPRRMQNTSPRIRRGGGSGVIVDADGKAQFALVKMVRIPARRWGGFSAGFMAKLRLVLLEYILTGKIGSAT